MLNLAAAKVSSASVAVTPPIGTLQTSPTAVDFGSQNITSQSAKQITIQNTGAINVTISGVIVSGTGFSANISSGFTLAPGQQTLLQVTFHPVSAGTVTGQVTLLSSNLNSPVIVPLVGTGLNSTASAAQTAQVNSTATANAASPSTTTTTTGQQSATLSWNASTSAVVGYKVRRGTTKGGPYPASTSEPVNTLSYTDTSVVAGNTYYYVVTSVDQNGVESAYSNEAVATIPASSSSPPPTSTTTTPTTGPSSPVTGMVLKGSAVLNGTRLRLTTQGQNLAGSAWYSSPVNVASFSNDFTFQLTNSTSNAMGNGLTFVIQNAGTGALGPSGGGLGYGPDKPSGASSSSNSPIAKSVAIKFDLVNNAGEGTNSTGLYKNGASPSTPAVNLGGGVNLHSGDIFQVHMIYDGSKLTMSVTDTAHTSQTFTTSWPIDIAGTVGSKTAYVGFTAGTGNSVGNQDIVSWTYVPTSTGTTTTPTASKTPIVYRSTALTAVSSGPTFRTFAYPGFPDTNGTILDATAIGQNVTFTVNVPTAGKYDVKLSYKKMNTRGISQLTINGANLGSPLDQYFNGEAYGTVDYGVFTFANAGNYSFKFTMVAKNSSSSNYSVSFDDFTLTPQ